MKVYVDSSTLVRVILKEPGAPASWSRISMPVSSELIGVECLRTVDRARLRLSLQHGEVARRRSERLEAIGSFAFIGLDGRVLARASEPFPTLLRTLEAIHLASALLARQHIPDRRFATHDSELGLAARAVGFELLA